MLCGAAITAYDCMQVLSEILGQCLDGRFLETYGCGRRQQGARRRAFSYRRALSKLSNVSMEGIGGLSEVHCLGRVPTVVVKCYDVGNGHEKIASHRIKKSRMYVFYVQSRDL